MAYIKWQRNESVKIATCVCLENVDESENGHDEYFSVVESILLLDCGEGCINILAY